MSAQTLQMDIDQRGKSWWNFIDLWQTAPCFTTRSMYSLPLFSIHFSLGAFNAQTCSGWGTQRWRSTWKRWQMCEKLFCEAPQVCWWERLICEIEGRRAKASAAVVSSSSDFRGNGRNREIPVMWKISHRCCICFSHSERHFVFTQLACCFYVLWPRSVENIWLIPYGWVSILNFIRTIALGQHPWLTTGTTKMLSVFQVFCRKKSVASEAERNKGIWHVRHSFDQ